MKKSSSVVLKIAAALALCVAAGWYFFGAASAEAPAPFRTADAQTRDIVLAIDATGTVEPEDLVDVGARVSGEILQFGKDVRGREIDYGSEVREGDLLALVDDEIPQSELLKAKASLAQAKANELLAQAKARKAERDWKRAERLGVTEALSQSAYDAYLSEWESAAAEVEVAKAGITQAEASLRTAERNLEYCVIKAPVNGVVIDRVVNIGQTVVSNMNASSLFLIAKDMKKMEVWASVNEADIGQIFEGQTVTFTVDAFPNETFVGKVGKVRLNATMTQNVVTYIVEVQTDNASGRLLPYLTANLQFEVKRADAALAVPNAALRFSPAPDRIAEDADPEALAARAKVWVQVDARTVRPVPVTVGISDGEWTAVSGALKAGDAVVTGVSELKDASAATKNPFAPTPPRRARQNNTAPASRS